MRNFLDGSDVTTFALGDVSFVVQVTGARPEKLKIIYRCVTFTLVPYEFVLY